MSILEEDKIVIWSKRLIDLDLQPDTILLLISKFDCLKRGVGIWFVIPLIDNCDNENMKLKDVILEFNQLGIQSLDLVIERLKSLYNYKSKLNESFSGLYGNEFNKIIHGGICE